MRDPCEHPADLGPVGQDVGRSDLAEPERAQRAALLGLGADARSHQRHLHLRFSCHIAHATSVISCFPARSRSRYALSMPLVDTSSGDLPRSLAMSSGRRSARSPCMVARATLIAFADPSDLASTSWVPADSRI